MNKLQKAEAEVIEQAMEENQFNRSAAARDIGLSRGTMSNKLKKYFGDKYVKTRKIDLKS